MQATTAKPAKAAKAPKAAKPETAKPEAAKAITDPALRPEAYGLPPAAFAALESINAQRRAENGGQSSAIFDLRLRNTTTAIDLHSSKAGARAVSAFTPRLIHALNGIVALHAAGVTDVQARIFDAGQAAILINSGLLALPASGATRGGAGFLLRITGKHLPAPVKAKA